MPPTHQQIHHSQWKNTGEGLRQSMIHTCVTYIWQLGLCVYMREGKVGESCTCLCVVCVCETARQWQSRAISVGPWWSLTLSSPFVTSLSVFFFSPSVLSSTLFVSLLLAQSTTPLLPSCFCPSLSPPRVDRAMKECPQETERVTGLKSGKTSRVSVETVAVRICHLSTGSRYARNKVTTSPKHALYKRQHPPQPAPFHRTHISSHFKAGKAV